MFNWLKRKKKFQKKCQHYKEFGEKWPPNMMEIFRFSPYKTDTIGYGVSECIECKKRAFSCIGLHMMTEKESNTIDAFIGHKIDYNEFKEFLNKNMSWVRGVSNE